jgi:hypothetical protein
MSKILEKPKNGSENDQQNGSETGGAKDRASQQDSCGQKQGRAQEEGTRI